MGLLGWFAVELPVGGVQCSFLFRSLLHDIDTSVI